MRVVNTHAEVKLPIVVPAQLDTGGGGGAPTATEQVKHRFITEKLLDMMIQ